MSRRSTRIVRISTLLILNDVTYLAEMYFGTWTTNSNVVVADNFSPPTHTTKDTHKMQEKLNYYDINTGNYLQLAFRTVQDDAD